MSRFTPRSESEVTNRILAHLKARTVLTDVRPNGVLAQLAGGVGRQIAEGDTAIAAIELLYDIDECAGEDLDDRGVEVLPSEQERGPATKASGYLVFSRQGIIGDITIPEGSRASLEAEGRKVVYHTTAAGTIFAGSTDSGDIPAVCSEAGAIGNSEPVDMALVGPVAGVTSVSTPTGFTGGNDQQSDVTYRQAMRSHVRGLGKAHKDGVITEVRKAVYGERSARFVAVKSYPDISTTVKVLVDDGMGTAGAETDTQAAGTLLDSAYGGEMDLLLPNGPIVPGMAPVITVTPAPGIAPVVYEAWALIHCEAPLTAGMKVEFAEYPYYTGLIKDAQKRLDGDPADKVNYPGCAPSGSYHQAQPAIVHWVSVAGTLTIESYATAVTIQALAVTAIMAYVNNLDIGEPCYRSRIIEAVMGVDGVTNFETEFTTSYVGDEYVNRVKSAAISLPLAA